MVDFGIRINNLFKHLKLENDKLLATMPSFQYLEQKLVVQITKITKELRASAFRWGKIKLNESSTQVAILISNYNYEL